MWDQVTDDDEEEQAEDAVDEDVGSGVTLGILGFFMLIHRQGLGTEQPSKQWYRSQEVWVSVSERHVGQRAYTAPRGLPARRGPGPRAKMEGGGGSPKRGVFWRGNVA